jgi:hypothetical protein
VEGERAFRERRVRGGGEGRVRRKGLPALTRPSMLLGAAEAVLELVVGEPLVGEEGGMVEEEEDGEAEAEKVDDAPLTLLAGEDDALVLELETLPTLLDPRVDDDPLLLLLPLPTLDEPVLSELLPLDEPVLSKPLPLDDALTLPLSELLGEPLALKDALTLPLPLDPLLEPEVELPGGETVTVLDTYTVLAALARHMLRWLVNVITMTWPSASGARHAASTTRPNTGDMSIDRKKKRRRSSKGG